MFFKLECIVRDLLLSSASEPRGLSYPVVLQYDGKRKIRVELRPRTEDEEKIGHAATVTFCTAFGEYEPKEIVLRTLEALERGDVPEGSTVPPDASWIEAGSATRIKPNHATPRSVLPQAVRSFLDAVDNDLWDHARRTVRVARWRTAAKGPHEPFSFKGVYRSSDGSTWHPVPIDTRALVEQRGSTMLAPAVVADVTALVSAGQDEPLPHQMFREAWEQRHQNRRSALILAVAAAEVAVKQLAAGQSSQLAWLVREVPSPPIEKMLREYLPVLVEGAEVPGSLLEEIKKSVNARNGLVHKEALPPDHDVLERWLLAIRDVLWLLECFGGREWARDHLSEATKAALKARSTSP